MCVFLSILVCFIIVAEMSSASPNQGKNASASENHAKALRKVSQEFLPRGDSRVGPHQTIEEYEREKLDRLKRSIGKRFIAVRTNRPADFYESPDHLENRFSVKRDKEEFLVVDVVQNHLGTKYFYQVRFDSGKIGYLSADGYYLEYRMKEGCILPVLERRKARKPTEKMKKEVLNQAVELVKNHLTQINPMTGETKSVEERMREVKARSFPSLRWRYEAKAIGSNVYRVVQYSEGEGGNPIRRTWIVDLSTSKVSPENLAAKELYR